MIRPLRETHLRIWVILALALATLFVSALLTRNTDPLRNPDLNWESLR